MEASQRVRSTNPAIILQMLKYSTPGLIPLTQGLASWKPPAAAEEALVDAMRNRAVHKYDMDQGIQTLRDMLTEKIAAENGIVGKDVMVTGGANQAFLNVTMTLCDPGDEVVLLAPFYFNHHMTSTLCNAVPVVVRASADFRLDVAAVERAMTPRTRMVVLVNPNNPTGHVYARERVEALQALCAERGVWLVSDETYENFLYDGAEHFSPKGDNVLNIFSFSKAYGLAGYRVGYVCVPPHLTHDMLKVQDSVPISACCASQWAAVGALRGAGSAWVREQLKQMETRRARVWKALARLHAADATPPRGAMYIFARLPEGIDSSAFAQWLAMTHKVSVLPGDACGAPGCFRVAYGALDDAQLEVAAERLERGIAQVLSDPPAAVLTTTT